MDDRCQLHEDKLINRLNSVIDDKVEYSVTTKINKLSRWLLGFVLTISVVFVGFFINNSYWMGRIDERNEGQAKILAEFISEQKAFNKTLSGVQSDMDKNYESKIGYISAYQFVIMRNMHKLDPTFKAPEIITRGGEE